MPIAVIRCSQRPAVLRRRSALAPAALVLMLACAVPASARAAGSHPERPAPNGRPAAGPCGAPQARCPQAATPAAATRPVVPAANRRPVVPAANRRPVVPARPAVVTQPAVAAPTGRARPTPAAALPRGDRFAAVLGKALDDPALAGAQVGALVVETLSGRVRFARNADTRFIPASTLKLLTAAAAFTRLGPEYAWLTPVLAGGPVVDGTVQGDLYVKGSGDPSFVAEQIFRLAATIRAAGVRRVDGAIVADSSLFTAEPEPPGWQLYDGPEAYHPPIGALSYNFNAVEVTVRPTAPGQPPLVLLDPPTSYVRVLNHAETVPTGTPDALVVGAAVAAPQESAVYAGVQRPPREADGSAASQRLAAVDLPGAPGVAGPALPLAVLEVRGQVPADGMPRRAARRVEGPALYFATALRDALRAVGLDVLGGVREGVTPPDAQTLLIHRSRALAPILTDMGKFSNNFMAEMVLRTLGVEATAGPAGSAAGTAVMRDVLRQLGADPAQAVIMDGSGLSRLNLLTPRHLAAVLRAMDRRFDARAEFAAGFGLLGVDGTVQRRYADSPASRKVRAKTGSLNGVRSLAGYAEGPRGEALAFVVFMNHVVTPIDRVVTAERRFVEALTGLTP
jgi:D-alanyl-D-alanine carboxypeptidase/D-alanyl-D-alanine-endopeptidase (penicillin-binding protein 4)